MGLQGQSDNDSGKHSMDYMSGTSLGDQRKQHYGLEYVRKICGWGKLCEWKRKSKLEGKNEHKTQRSCDTNLNRIATC